MLPYVSQQGSRLYVVTYTALFHPSIVSVRQPLRRRPPSSALISPRDVDACSLPNDYLQRQQLKGRLRTTVAAVFLRFLQRCPDINPPDITPQVNPTLRTR